MGNQYSQDDETEGLEINSKIAVRIPRACTSVGFMNQMPSNPMDVANPAG